MNDLRHPTIGVVVKPTDDGAFNELVAVNSTVHVELLAPDLLWISITPEGSERRVALSVHARRRRLTIRTDAE